MKKLNLNPKITNKIIFLSIATLVFFYLLYLSIPSLYNSGRVQKAISEEIMSEFDLNISLSSDISYRILPMPHFIIRDSKLFNLQSKENNEIGEFKNLKVFIKQKNLFNKENIKIKKLVIDKGNFYFKKDGIIFIKSYLNKFFSNKNLFIKNSKFFYNDKNDNPVFIKTIKDSKLFFTEKDKKNNLNLRGEIFKIPFKLLWQKNFSDESKFLAIDFKKIPLNLTNKTNIENNKLINENNLNIFNSKLITNYTYDDKIIKINSKKSIIKNTPISYEGEIELKPFYFNLLIDAKEFDLKYLFMKSFWINEIIYSKFLENDNLNAKILINSDKLSKNKVFKKIALQINFEEGKINFNNSVLSEGKIGKLKVVNSEFLKKDDKIFLDSRIRIFVDDFDIFYKTFFISKNKRKKFKFLEFRTEFDTMEGLFKVYQISFYDLKGKKVNSQQIDDIVDVNIDKRFNYSNLIGFKNYLNKILDIYYLDG